MRRTLFALAGALALVVAVTAPGVAAQSADDHAAGNEPISVGISQADGVSITVTENGSGVANASVDVTTVDENASYVGTGSYTTDGGGTVSLPAPVENVTIAVNATHENRTTSTTGTLSATNASFGQVVSGVVAMLQGTDDPIGPALASWVVANNPGNAPAHAGPPDHAGPGGASNETDGGPPAHAGGPDDAGPTEDDERGPPTDDDRGLPEHAGPGTNETPDGDDGTDVDDGDDENDDDEGIGGPPEHAGGPDGAGPPA